MSTQVLIKCGRAWISKRVTIGVRWDGKWEKTFSEYSETTKFYTIGDVTHRYFSRGVLGPPTLRSLVPQSNKRVLAFQTSIRIQRLPVSKLRTESTNKVWNILYVRAFYHVRDVSRWETSTDAALMRACIRRLPIREGVVRGQELDLEM